MPIGWKPDISLEARIIEERNKLDQLEQDRKKQLANQWQPAPTAVTEPVAQNNISYAPITEQPQAWQPSPTYQAPQQVVSPMPTTTIPSVPPVTQPQTVTPIIKKETLLSPFEIPKDVPLWAKAVNIVGKPFELIQEYAFDPLLAAIHIPWTKQLTPSELDLAKKQGIMSYLPGGIRHQAYEDLKYPGKWAVEFLPWLIVPPMGTVGIAGAGGRGVAGALSKLGKVGQLAGRMVEYSPAGLAEKATGTVIGGITGKVSKIVTQPITTGDLLIDKAIKAIQSAQVNIPEQKVMTKVLRKEQALKVLETSDTAQGEQGFISMARAAGISGEKVEITGIRGQLTTDEVNKMYQKVIEYAQGGKPLNALAAGKALRVVLDGGNLPPPSELKELGKVFGEGMVSSLLQKQQESLFNKTLDILNASRSVLASGDISFPLRQGAILMARHPLKAPGVFTRVLKTVYSDKNAETLDTVIRSRKWTSIADDLVGEKGVRLELTELPSRYSKTSVSMREESYASRWINNVPIVGSMIKGSNRAFVSAANDIRSLAWEDTVNVWQKLSSKITVTENDYSQLARLINVASGRGDLPRMLRGSSNLLNATLFSPRLLFSRIQWPTMLFSSSPLVRKEAARQMVSFMGAGSSILGLCALTGAKIETDPRSADFGKLRIGNTRLDIWTGYTQWARFITQLTSAQRKTVGGNITELNRAEVVQRFAQSKASPLTSLIYDILRGESYTGEEVNLDTQNLQRQAYDRIAPLFVQDLLDAIEQEGMLGGLVALPGVVGVGVVTYLSPADKLRNQLAQDKYGMSWEDVGKKLGRATQMDLERSDSKLLAEITKEQETYNKTITGKSDVNNIYRNETQTIENYYKLQIDRATQEYRDTGDGYTFREKILEAASNRRSQYEILNKTPQFADIVARYDQLPSASDLQKMSPQDLARREYMRLMYSPDMYDQYGNYRFDMVDDIKQLFIDTFGQSMLDYIETYQGIKEEDLPAEYKMFREAQNVLRPYWQIQDSVIKTFGQTFTDSKRGQALIGKLRKQMRMANPEVNRYIALFYTQA